MYILFTRYEAHGAVEMWEQGRVSLRALHPLLLCGSASSLTACPLVDQELAVAVT